MTINVSVSKLRKMHACEEGVDLFRRIFGTRSVPLSTVLLNGVDDDYMGGKEWLIGRLLPRNNATAMKQLIRWWVGNYPTVPSRLLRGNEVWTAWTVVDDDGDGVEGVEKLQAFVDFFIKGKKYKG